MDTKIIKLYDVLIKYNEKDFSLRTCTAYLFLQELFAIDYDYGIYGCYFLFTKNEKLLEYKTINEDVTVTFLNEIFNANKNKTVKNILENQVLIKGFFTLANDPYTGVQLNILTDLLTRAKTDKAEILLKALIKNANASFGDGMVKVFDQYKKQLEIIQKTATPVLNKKTVLLLTEYTQKIKGEQKPLILQRIKELT